MPKRAKNSTTAKTPAAKKPKILKEPRKTIKKKIGRRKVSEKDSIFESSRSGQIQPQEDQENVRQAEIEGIDFQERHKNQEESDHKHIWDNEQIRIKLQDDDQSDEKQEEVSERKIEETEMKNNDLERLKRNNNIVRATSKFQEIIKNTRGKMMSLNGLQQALDLRKRRVYDIANVLEGAGYLQKYEACHVKWNCEDNEEALAVEKYKISKLRSELNAKAYDLAKERETLHKRRIQLVKNLKKRLRFKSSDISAVVAEMGHQVAIVFPLLPGSQVISEQIRQPSRQGGVSHVLRIPKTENKPLLVFASKNKQLQFEASHKN